MVIIDFMARKNKTRGTHETAGKRKPKAPPKPSPRPRGRKQFYSDADVAAALKRGNGLVAKAAEILNCDRETIYTRARHVPEIQALIQGRFARMGDEAEKRLYQALLRGDWRALDRCLRLIPGDPYGLKQPAPAAENAAPQQNVLVLQNAAALPIEALRALVEAVRQQRRGQVLAQSQPAEGAVLADPQHVSMAEIGDLSPSQPAKIAEKGSEDADLSPSQPETETH